MTDQESLLAAIHVQYDPAWPKAFEAERRRLLSLFPGVSSAIEHIGSTAIPRMSAKPAAGRFYRTGTSLDEHQENQPDLA